MDRELVAVYCLVALTAAGVFLLVSIAIRVLTGG